MFRKLKYIVSFVLIFFLMNSCIEIIDDISLNSDGTGTFKYTINLSSNKVKVNSILALDSLNGKKVPSIKEIEEKIAIYKEKIEKKEGISNVKFESNFEDFIIKFQCDFTNVGFLQKAVKEIVIEEDKSISEVNHTWLIWDGNKFIRSAPKITSQSTNNLKNEDITELKKGKYVSITRFDRFIDKSENSLAEISKNKLNIMIKTDPYSLSKNVEIIENTIHLTPKKQP
jgi:hypothetical protein